MLDEYQNIQPIVYQILKNAVSQDKYSHAYLFETNGFYDSFNFIFAFVKSAMCPKHYTHQAECASCDQCQVIDSGNFPEIKIITPDGLWIKKEQLQELQSEFTKKALIGTKKIYIINGAEKLNKQAANSILKFLEEPEEGIMAILITDNIYQVLETIRSRCQIIKLKEVHQTFSVENTLNKLNLLLFEENRESNDNLEKIEKAINLVNYYEKNHLDTIIYMNKLWHDYIKNKDDIIRAFDVMIMYYREILNSFLHRKIELFHDYQTDIAFIKSKNTLNSLCTKLNILTEFKEKVKYNANVNLLMDKLIIELEGGI